MEKNLYISILLDFYGKVLTDKQREVVELYYNEDLSLAEIAEHVGITRQGVRDSIKRGEKTLLELEEKLGMEKTYSQLQNSLMEIKNQADIIKSENTKILSSKEIDLSVKRIKKISDLLLNEKSIKFI